MKKYFKYQNSQIAQQHFTGFFSSKLLSLIAVDFKVFKLFLLSSLDFVDVYNLPSTLYITWAIKFSIPAPLFAETYI